jgi:hypothetical protein
VTIIRNGELPSLMQCKTFTDYFAVESEDKRKAAIDAENKKCTTQNIKGFAKIKSPILL